MSAATVAAVAGTYAARCPLRLAGGREPPTQLISHKSESSVSNYPGMIPFIELKVVFFESEIV